MENNEVRLSDLTNKAPQEEILTKVNIEDIAQKKEEPKPEFETNLDEVFSELNKQSDQVFEQAKEIITEKQLEASIDEDTNGDEPDSDSDFPYLSIDESKDKSDVLGFDDSEFDYDFDEEDEKEEVKEDKSAKQMESIKADIKQKIQPFTKKVDLASFTVSNKPSKVHKLFNLDTPKENTADWVLYSTGTPVTMKEFKAFDIEKLSPNGSTKNRINTFRTIYKLMYDHIIDENKSEFEEWLKLVHFTDLEHLYFAVFRSSFEQTNMVPYLCGKCGEGYVDKIEDIFKMVTFESDEIKEKFNLLLKKDSTSIAESYESELVQITDEYVIGLRIPTLYSVIFENFALSDSFQEKNSEFLNMVAFIDKIYIIDTETKSLDPVFLKEYENDIAKTTQYKMKTYKAILDSLSSDQFYLVQQLIGSISKSMDAVSYQLPESKCPKCEHITPATKYKAESLLFTRHQLTSLATI